MDTLDIKNLSVVKKPLHQPELSEVSEVLSKGLAYNFAEVNVEVVVCPDLTKNPFTLVSPGLSGKPQLFDLGGIPYMIPTVNRDKNYDVVDLLKLADMDPIYCIGAGTGPWPYLGVNCEGIFNLSLNKGIIDQKSYITTIQPLGALKGGIKLEKLPETETRCSVLANLFVSQGKPGKVLKIVCKKRTGRDSFTTSIRKSLQSQYKDKPVGLGGTFIFSEGKAKLHNMPDFSMTPLNNTDDVDNWLNFYEMSGPLINIGTLISHDPDLDLRMQHFHTFSHHREGGHYHIDTTPDTANYIGYFSVAETIIRVDAPKKTHFIARHY